MRPMHLNNRKNEDLWVAHSFSILYGIIDSNWIDKIAEKKKENNKCTNISREQGKMIWI